MCVKKHLSALIKLCVCVCVRQYCKVCLSILYVDIWILFNITTCSNAHNHKQTNTCMQCLIHISPFWFYIKHDIKLNPNIYTHMHCHKVKQFNAKSNYRYRTCVCVCLRMCACMRIKMCERFVRLNYANYLAHNI